MYNNIKNTDMKTKLFFSGLIMMIVAFSWFKFTQVDVAGSVINQDGKAIGFGELEIYTADANPKLIQKTTTDFDGNFMLEDLMPGVYNLVVRAEGFGEHIETVHLSRNTKELQPMKVHGDVVILSPAVIYSGTM